MILLDTNVLVYAVDASAARYRSSRKLVDAALAPLFPAALVPQVLLEFYAVVTHSRRTKNPLDAATAWAQVEALQASIPVLHVAPQTLAELRALVASHGRTGSGIYDLFLAAQMRTHGIATICTYNVRDFAPLPGIDVTTPEALLARHNVP